MPPRTSTLRYTRLQSHLHQGRLGSLFTYDGSQDAQIIVHLFDRSYSTFAPSAMPPYKTAFVFCVTGEQGRSVTSSLLKAGYTVTGLTRNASSASAKELKTTGANIVQGDMNDPSSYRDHLQGDVVYLTADSFGILFSVEMDNDRMIETEVRQSLSAAEACVRHGVKHIVYQYLEGYDDQPTPPYMTCKEIVKRNILEMGIPATFLRTCAYYENCVKLGFLKKREDGSFLLDQNMPDDTRIPSFSVTQIGEWVKAILDDPEVFNGKTVDACGEYVTITEMAQAISEQFNIQVDTLHMSKEEFYREQNLQKPMPQVWLNWKAYVEAYFVRDPAASRQTFPGAWAYKEWVEQSAELKAFVAA